jgi:hypothetical protein
MVALVLAVAGLAVWRATCVALGPDIDTDAYAHHMIARAILADPGDLAVHWVWLPLFHYVQVPLVALGVTMQGIRWANIALAAALPCVLFVYVRATARAEDAPIPAGAIALFAALFAGACPIAMQMGTTAQPEPLFALLVLGVAITFERRRYGAAAALLGAAVMTRYEAWAVLAAVAVLLVAEPWWGKRSGKESWIVVVVPVVLILAWAALRRPVDGQWFGFLRQTREFANGALRENSALDRGAVALASDVLYYPVVVPFRVLGPVLWLAPFGAVRTFRQQGSRFVLVFLACLGFLSLSWVMRSTLGLDRHFVVVIPLYATCAAQGAVALGDWVARRTRRVFRDEGRSASAGRGVGYALALVALLGLFVELDVWMGFWRASIARGWPERAELGAYLRSLPSSSAIFCDDATLEITSGLDRRRFDRHWIDDPQTWQRVKERARALGAVYVATWRRKLQGHETAGDIVFRAGFDPKEQDRTGVAIMRVSADADSPNRSATQ